MITTAQMTMYLKTSMSIDNDGANNKDSSKVQHKPKKTFVKNTRSTLSSKVHEFGIYQIMRAKA